MAVAVVLVLVSAALHLLWNSLVKAADDPVRFSLWMQGVGALAALPIGLVLGGRFHPKVVLFATGSGIFYALYYCAMGTGYRLGEISRAYPIVRGVAPAAACLAGVWLYGERPSALASIGMLVVILATLAIARLELGTGRVPGRAAWLAVVAGFASAGYLVVDKQGIAHANPALYLSLSFGAGFVLQAFAMRAMGWAVAPPAVTPARLGWAGLACAGGYLLILVAMGMAPLSVVVPLRAASVVFSVYAGARLFGEPSGAAKYVAATAILAGIVAIGLG
ncbi:MAG: EamA family transporter [Fimbriimonadaceae bacterium]|nr:EamA family transporter [Fimbriimonadaceae bacterium]